MDYREKSRTQLISEVSKLTDLASKLEQSNADHLETKRHLRENKELYNSLLEHSMDGVYIHDFQGNFIDANPAALEILGYDEEEIDSINLVSLLDPEQLEQVVKNNIQLIATGKYAGVSEFQLTRKDGTRVWVESKGSVIYRDDTPYCIMGIARDITERKELTRALENYRDELEKRVAEQTGALTKANEQLRKEIADRKRAEEELIRASKVKSLGVFAGGLAHDFNNYLTSILGSISLAKIKLREDNDSYRTLSFAEKAALRTKDLTFQLLTFAKGGAPIKQTATVADLLRETADFVLSGSHLERVYKFAPDLWNAELDAGQFSQVISNIVVNSIQATPNGGTIKIEANNFTAPDETPLPCGKGKYIQIRITDNGEGIDEREMSSIFDPYFTNKKHGTGLGLAVVYSVIKNHSGHVELQSVKGDGTAFTIYLPATQKPIPFPLEDTHEAISGRGRRVLVMDDEKLVLETLNYLLEELEFDVTLARDGEAALSLYRMAKEDHRPFDIVVMDLTVPGGNGGEKTIKNLLEYDPHAKAIVSSGYSDNPVMANYQDYGFVDILPKPYNFDQLVAMLGRVLRTHH